jgi:hypothetical protein
MRSILVSDFAGNIILLPDKKIRNPGSKHQRKIDEIQPIIQALALTGEQNLAQKLVDVEIIPCQGSSDYVAHLRYLQYCINYLRTHFDHFYEGKQK